LEYKTTIFILKSKIISVFLFEFFNECFEQVSNQLDRGLTEFVFFVNQMLTNPLSFTELEIQSYFYIIKGFEWIFAAYEIFVNGHIINEFLACFFAG
jgi:hypothetical protein